MSFIETTDLWNWASADEGLGPLSLQISKLSETLADCVLEIWPNVLELWNYDCKKVTVKNSSEK